MKIVSLQANNILRLKAISIQADGKSVTLSGKNGSGKTSVIRCIEMALAGADSIAEKPIHGDEEFGRVILDLGDFKVTRTFQKKDSQTTLKVTSKEGALYPSPQSILNGLYGKLSFDPLEFARMGDREPEKQLKTLKTLVGLDFAALDAERAQIYAERTLTGRDLKAAEMKVAGKMPFSDPPPAEVSVASLMQELNKAQEHNRAIEEAGRSLCNDRLELDQDRKNLATAKQEIAELESRLAALKIQVDEKIKAGKEKVERLKKREEKVSAMVPIDVSTIENSISSADTTNANIRFNAQLTTDLASCTVHKEKQEAQTKRIEEIDAEKQRQLKETKFPLKGLGFSETGVTLNDLPFDQASAGEQLRASAAIGIALNPKLRVLLIRDASLLDKDGLKILAEMAALNDCQVWIEKVGESEEVAVTIEGEDK